MSHTHDPQPPNHTTSPTRTTSAGTGTSATSAGTAARRPHTNRRVAGVAARFKASLLGRDRESPVEPHGTPGPQPEPQPQLQTQTQPQPQLQPLQQPQPQLQPLQQPQPPQPLQEPSDREAAPSADRDFAEVPRTPQSEGPRTRQGTPQQQEREGPGADWGGGDRDEGPRGGGTPTVETQESAGEERGRDRESRRPWREGSVEPTRRKGERPWRRRVWQAHDKHGGTTEAGHAVKSSQALLYGSPAPRRRLSRTEGGEEVEEKAWNDESLLRMTDWWRQVLVAGETPGQHELRMMNSFLSELLAEETPALDMILRTRLHKLVDAIVEADVVVPREGPVEKWFHQLARKAQEVQRKWKAELDGRLEDFQEERRILCGEGGRLWAVQLVEQPGELGLKWMADTIGSGGFADFEPGAWWLNDACAQRDGIVGNSRGYVATQHSEPVITLEVGEEVPLASNMNVTRYIYEGPMQTLMVPLLRLLDKQVRVLRVYTLKSKLAPSAGLRYDGLYNISSYSYRRVGAEERFHVEITMERSKDQGPMEKVLLVPTPSMLDDWEVYLGIVEEKVRASISAGQYEERQQNETEEEMEREAWHTKKEKEEVEKDMGKETMQ